MESLTTGELARRADVHIETLRYYERRGLLPRPPRNGSNRRKYPIEALVRVRFVKRAQGLGFSLTEIQELLSLRTNPVASCGDVQAQARSKLREIEDKLRALRAMRTTLRRLIAECPGDGPTSRCNILAAFESGDLP